MSASCTGHRARRRTVPLRSQPLRSQPLPKTPCRPGGCAARWTHLRAHERRGRLRHWPRARRQDEHLKVPVAAAAAPLALLSSEGGGDVLANGDVGKHALQLGRVLDAAGRLARATVPHARAASEPKDRQRANRTKCALWLYLEPRDHVLFVAVRRRLAKDQPAGQQARVVLLEDILVVQVAEEHNLRQAGTRPTSTTAPLSGPPAPRL